MNVSVVGMEDYPATDERPLDLSLKGVAKADLYVGIFAWRYGFIPPAWLDTCAAERVYGFSNAERRLGKPVFVHGDGDLLDVTEEVRFWNFSRSAGTMCRTRSHTRPNSLDSA